jgi:geranylgeranyl diphosphate synthase type I
MISDLELFKKRFDVYLEKHLEKKIKNIGKFTKSPLILSYIRYLKKNSLSGGKRIRPYLAYLMYQTFSEKENEEIMEFLVFLEIFHAFCLVHDDIMDKSALRHGIPTAHAHISNLLKQEGRIGDIVHAGNSQAILLGDMLFSWSQEIINSSRNFSREIISSVNVHFYEMIDEVVVGQMIDVDIATRKKATKELIDEKTRLKTAGYSFIKPLLIGATLSGNADKNIGTFCERFGLAMGIAFQTQDDLLDITSSNSELGKPTSSDKSRNQHTYFTYFPSLEYGKRIIKDNFRQAKELVEKLKIKNQYKQKFLNFVAIIENRKS